MIRDVPLRDDRKSFVGQFFLPAGHILRDYGVLRTTESALELDFDDSNQRVSGYKYFGVTNEFLFSFSGDIFNIQGYIVTEDAEGTLHYTLGNVVTYTLIPAFEPHGVYSVGDEFTYDDKVWIVTGSWFNPSDFLNPDGSVNYGYVKTYGPIDEKTDEWRNYNTYTEGDIVSHEGFEWIARGGGANSAEPGTDSTGWNRMFEAWFIYNSYETDDIVLHEGQYWLALTSNRSRIPGEVTWAWELIEDYSPPAAVFDPANDYSVGDTFMYEGTTWIVIESWFDPSDFLNPDGSINFDYVQSYGPVAEKTNEWRDYNTYSVGDIVWHEGFEWVVRHDDANMAEPGTDTIAWNRVSAEWFVYNTYENGDIVLYEAQYWTALTSNRGEVPSDAPWAWEPTEDHSDPIPVFDPHGVYAVDDEFTYDGKIWIVTGSWFNPSDFLNPDGSVNYGYVKPYAPIAEQTDEWRNYNTYTEGDIVWHEGFEWIARGGGANSAEPGTNSTGWNRMSKAWFIYNSYETDDIVLYAGQYWIALTSNRSRIPGEVAWAWEAMED